MLPQIINAEQRNLAVPAIHRAIWQISPVTHYHINILQILKVTSILPKREIFKPCNGLLHLLVLPCILGLRQSTPVKWKDFRCLQAGFSRIYFEFFTQHVPFVGVCEVLRINRISVSVK